MIFMGRKSGDIFGAGLEKIFPDRPIEDISAEEALYEMPFPRETPERLQVPGPATHADWPHLSTRRRVTPHWRGVRDDQGRWMVVISHNIDYGEGWEQADTPQYPETVHAPGL